MTEDRVYFIRSIDSGLIKIGHSTNPEQRLKQLRSVTKERLEFALIGPGGYEAEQKFHQAFDVECFYGEWFRPSDRLEATIRALNGLLERYALPVSVAYWGEWAGLL